MIKTKHTKYFERKMRSTKVEYITDAGSYCNINDIKVPFCMPEFCSIKIIEHRFHVQDKIGELVIDYDMIIGSEMMVKLGLSENLKREFLQRHGIKASMKEPMGLIGKS